MCSNESYSGENSQKTRKNKKNKAIKADSFINALKNSIILNCISTGINALQDRRSALAGISNSVQMANDATAKAGANAEQQQRQDLGILGAATGMKSAEDRRKFDMKYNLLAQKAGQSATTENMGYRNIFGGISNLATMLGGAEKKEKNPVNDPFPYGI